METAICFHSSTATFKVRVRGTMGRDMRVIIAFVTGGGGHDEKWEQTGKEMAQRHLTHNDKKNFQDGAEGSC